MRGVGGPLLCIGDLLNDVGEGDSGVPHDHPTPPPAAADTSNLQPSDLPKLFQENFDQLKAAFDGEDHSWTALTLKLCSAMETANKLIESSNSRVSILSENVEDLEKIVTRRDSAIAAVDDIQGSLKVKDLSNVNSTK
ncbi:unnamed protein product [Fraxinus pennsylvanica]|uniref:Uncharacterized protein n=1 Tax=Fraxinus pennsylvanica TaxID=56036 RepID=A0AAD1Z743_9LAMI|nr:unnamed protein product [Fraxinus pennsylvanica]